MIVPEIHSRMSFQSSGGLSGYLLAMLSEDPNICKFTLYNYANNLKGLRGSRVNVSTIS